MAYGAYQLAQPGQSLLSSMVERGFGPSVDPSIKKKGVMDEFKEQLERKSKSAEKRSQKWQPVTQALDFAAGFVDPATAAIMGAVSGGLSGYDRMRAYEGLKDFGKQYEGMGFMDDLLSGAQEQIGGLDTDIGDVLVSAGTGALKNFAMGKASEAMAGLGKAKQAAPKGTEGGDALSKLDPGASLDSFELKAPEGGFKPSEVTDISKQMKPVEMDMGLKLEKMPSVEQKIAAGKPGRYAAGEVRPSGRKIGGYKPEGADWIKKLQEGGGKDMLSQLFKDDPMGALAQLTQMGQGFLEPLMNQNKRSDFRLY